MKRTPLAFLAAVGLYLAATVLPREEPGDHVTVPLDMHGIVEVEVDAASGMDIQFTTAAPELRYPVGADHHVTVTRQAGRLRITSDVTRYQALEIQLPATVRKLVVTDATIDADIGLDTLVIEAGDNLRWSGNVGKLTVIDGFAQEAQPPAAECAPFCGLSLTFDDGDIGELAVTTRHSSVVLANVDTIRQTRLTLGKGAQFSLSGATRIPDITLLPHPAETQAPEAKKP
jgi:hypothetical protein